ncbi:hypothetical protein EI613_10495 [Azospirillum sp. 412522]|nr:AAA family ATPase [Azospirillum sp. 412522]MBY6262336.1 hypothetical protein [Azospirillum sp. 412522]
MSAMVAGVPETLAYDVTVSKVISFRLGGVIFAGTVAGPFGDPREGTQIRAMVPGGVLAGAEPIEGETWHLCGAWATSDRYGEQFHARMARRARPAGHLVVSYLAYHVPGIGTGRAKRLWDAFEERLPEVLDAGDVLALAQVIAPRFPTLSVRLAADVVTQWKEATVEPAVMAWLDGLGVTDARFVRRAVCVLGERTRSTLEANPYILAAFLDHWKRVDKLGRRLMAEAGTADVEDHPNRLVGAVDFVVRKAITEGGHTVIDEATLRRGLARCFGGQLSSRRVTDAIRLGEVNNAIIPYGQGKWRAPGCAALEDALVARFRAMRDIRELTAVEIPSGKALEACLRALAPSASLHPEQREAVLRCIQAPLAVLTGGAGVGKTTTLRTIVDLWEFLDGNVQMVALAGKAALRMSQATGRPAMTIHRFLNGLLMREASIEQNAAKDQANWERESQKRSGDRLWSERREEIPASEFEVEEGPYLDNRSLLVVDEASMVDLGQWHRLVQAMPAGCRLLLVGDVGQLPPIGFGLVFHRLAHIPALTAELQTIHRQREGGGIPEVSRAIRAGIVPELQPFGGRADGVFLVPCPMAEIPSQIERVVAELGGFGSTHAVQIVAPVNQGDAGVDGLNERFHNRHREATGAGILTLEHAEVKEVKGFLGNVFGVGEPAIHRRNDYQRGLFNGSLGHVVSVDVQRRALTALFDGEPHEFVGDELIDLALAYCLTCHRLQGSQAERVVVALYDHPLVDISWIYTAITRAERQVVLVGDSATLAAAVSRPPAWTNRCVAFRLDPENVEGGPEY